MDLSTTYAEYKDAFQRWFHDVPRFDSSDDEVTVIGAGIMGLTVALALSLHGHSVCIVAEEWEDTCSAISAAVWLPFGCEDPRVGNWSRETFQCLSSFLNLAAERHGGVYNISRLPVDDGLRKRVLPVCFVDSLTFSERADDMFDDIPHWVPAREIVRDSLPYPNWKCGLRWTSVITQSNQYLSMLRALLRDAGVRFEQRRVRQPLDATKWNFVCCGLGAKELLGDGDVFPIQGQVVAVYNDPRRPLMFLDTVHDPSLPLSYIIPRSDCTIVGGTAVEGARVLAPSSAVATDILARADHLQPGISKAKVMGTRVGLRPARRLECRVERHGARTVYCYGFGGSGWTVHLGAARAALAAAVQQAKM